MYFAEVHKGNEAGRRVITEFTGRESGLTGAGTQR